MVGSYCYCYFFFLISILLYTLVSPTSHHCHYDQRDALLEFKDEFPILQYNPSANDASLSSWNKSSDCCFWEGVTCDAKSSKVISLDLDSISLNNSLKPNSGLFKLQHLRILTLSHCHLSGEIPFSLGNLSRLTKLDLWDNKLIGQVPALIGSLTQLRYLDLGHNNFNGNIPLSFSNLTKLTDLYLYDNYFKSTLPPFVSRFHNLEYFNVAGNSFFGLFPTSLFTISSLKFVNLEENQFKGPVDFENTSSTSRLQYLYLAYNHFNGPIPDSISKFLNLEVLHLICNNFIGPIPRSISNLVKLEYLDLFNNKLEGEVPSCLWRLTTVMLSYNSFSSFEKTSQVHDEKQIVQLDLSSNSFRGPFPRWICKLRSLRFLDMSKNSFNGSIPQCFWNSTVNLTDLILHNNNFSGIFPDIFVNATKLLSLDVSHNKLEGKLPKSLINSKAMEFLNVKNNRIKDKFPSWLGSMPSLNVFILRSNEFYGSLYHPYLSIGFQSLRVIDISHNGFTGTLPPFFFSGWREMTKLTKESNTYVDDYVSYLGVYRNSMEMVHKGVETEFEAIRTDFRAIDFSGNRFYGNIPKSIGLLKELRLLNLSGNAFTSNIPQSLANLTNLEELDLSRNQLSGQIPRDLGTLSFLSTMNFSHNNLEGPIPRGTQFQRQNCSSFMDNPKLHGLEEICRETHVSNPTLQESENFSEPEEQVISWIAVAIAYGPGAFCGLVMGHIFASYKHEWFIKKFGRNKPRVGIRSTH